MRLLTLSLLMFTAFANANSEAGYRSNVQWAKDSIGNTQNKSGYKDFDVYTLCKDETCKQQVANPEQKRYYDNESALSGDAAREAATNEQSQAVTTSFNNGRPAIDPNDPAYAAAVGYQNDAYNISHGISSKYHDCEKGLRCEIGTTTKSCTVPTNLPIQCNITPDITTNGSKDEKIYPFTNGSLEELTLYSHVITNDERKISKVHIIGQFSNFELMGHAPQTVTPLYADDVVVGQLPLSLLQEKPPYHRIYTVNATVNLNASVNKIHFVKSTLVSFTGTANITFNDKTANVGYKNSCGALLPECQQTTRQCVEGEATRIIDGVSVTLDCWKEQITYKCNTPNTCASLSECTKQSSTCETSIEGVCITQKEQRLCETQQCQDVGLVCGEDSFALSGDYYEPDEQKSTDFNSAAAGLAAISEAAEDVKNAANVTNDSPIIFKGTPMSCTDKPIGISNCCQDGGWGTDIGIAECSEEEKALGEAKKDKLTVSLGTYCAEKVLGVCIRKKKSYCTFDSMLARIVQESGRPQLGLNFGSAKHPNCSALSPNQLQQINMENMDFSDFYEDMHEGTNLPDQDAIIDRLEQSMEGMK